MRLSLFVRGIFAAIVCIASPAGLSMLLIAIGQFPFITEKISEQALIKTALVLLPRLLLKSPGTLGPGLVIQRGDRMCMFRAWRPVGNSSGSFAIYSTQSPAPRRA